MTMTKTMMTKHTNMQTMRKGTDITTTSNTHNNTTNVTINDNNKKTNEHDNNNTNVKKEDNTTKKATPVNTIHDNTTPGQLITHTTIIIRRDNGRK